MVPQQLQQLLNEKHTLMEWQRLFGAILAPTQGGIVTSLDPEEFRSVKDRTMLQPESFGITPQKQEQRYLPPKRREEMGVEKMANKEEEISPIGNWIYDMDLDTLLAAQMDKVMAFGMNVASDLAGFKDTAGKDMDWFEAAIQDLYIKLGRDPGISTDPMLTAWEGIVFVSSMAWDASQAITALHNEVVSLQHNVGTLDKKVDALAATPGTLACLEGPFGQVTTLMNLLIQENDKLWNELRSAPTTSNTSGLTQEVSDLRMNIRDLEARVLAAEVRLTASQSLPVTGVPQPYSIPSVPHQPGFTKLLEWFKMLEARVTSKPVTVAGRVFLSELDVESWITQKAPTGVFYLFHDAVSLLECLNVTYMSRVDILTEMHQAAKVSINSEAEAKMITLFKMLLPAVLSGTSKEALASTGRHFPACNTYAAWNTDDGYRSLKRYIERGISDLRHLVNYDIETTLRNHPKAESLASDLHGLSQTCVATFCTWLDDFYRELCKVSNCTEAEAWDLASKCGKRFFEEL